ncbi:hypothetical protein [Pontibacter flavimaris]|uniref:hypothetical protein n=1 Tax=Pontibacter flavimaris TaxID=1797110 RepID=UPI00147B4BD8|nr:hypothetical protein [Pontibacter flavimaris]
MSKRRKQRLRKYKSSISKVWLSKPVGLKTQRIKGHGLQARASGSMGGYESINQQV